MIGQTSGTVFLDQNPVSGTSSYYAKAIKGILTGKEGSAKKITLPKATTKVTAKAKTDKTVVLSWKKVKVQPVIWYIVPQRKMAAIRGLQC